MCSNWQENCGVVTRVEGMFHAGRASGRAWVTFEEPTAATAALGFDRQEVTFLLLVIQSLEIFYRPFWSVVKILKKIDREVET